MSAAQQYAQLEQELLELRENGETRIREHPLLSQMDRLWHDMTSQERRQVQEESDAPLS